MVEGALTAPRLEPYARAPSMSLAAAPDLPPLVAERPEDAPVVERLILRAFGPGRFAKAAERLREGNHSLRALSFVAWRDGGSAIEALTSRR